MVTIIPLVSMSLGTSGSSDGTDVVSQAVNRAADAGIIPVIAAGNSGPARYTIGSPGAASRAVTVGAMSDPKEGGFGLAAFSSRGPTQDGRIKPDIAAPGVNITAPRAGSGNGYIAYSGTSMATPFVAGVTALLLDANPGLTVDQAKAILTSTAVDFGVTGQDVDYGWGRLDAWAAVRKAGNFSTGSPPAVPGHQIFTGTLATTGSQATHTFSIGDTSYALNVTMIMPDWASANSPDFDIYVYNPDGSELGRATNTSRQEQVSKPVTQTGVYKILVKSYSGSGSYVLDVSAGTGSVSDRPPAVSIDQPAEGARISGTTPVKIKATDDAAVAKVQLAVDTGGYSDITGSFDGAFYIYSWDTKTVANGAHTLTAKATDSAGQATVATRTVTVDNAAPPPPPEGLPEVVRTGQVTDGARDASVKVTVLQPGYMDLRLNWTTRADLDFYVYGPDGSLIGRAYTLNNPEQLRIDTVRFGTGTYTIKVNLYAGPDSAFTLTASGCLKETFSGSVSPSGRNFTQQREMAYAGRGRVVLSWPGSSDLDFFIYNPAGALKGQAFTLNNPEQIDMNVDGTGEWSIRVNLYAGAAASFTLSVYSPEAILK